MKLTHLMSISIVLAVALVVGIIRNASGPSIDVSRERHLKIAIPDDVETVDPPFSHFPISNEVNRNIYDQFLTYGFDDFNNEYRIYNPQKILGSAVESWKISADEKTMILKVRPAARFARTGNPVTAADFIYWFDRARALKAGTWFNVDSAGIESWDKTGDYEVTLHFNKPNPFFFYLFRDQSQAPVEEAVLKKHSSTDDPWSTRWAARNDAGSGAYYIEKWVPGVEVTLKANPYYRGGPSYFQTVTLYIVPSSAARALLLARGAVDIAEQLGAVEIDNLRGITGIRIISAPSREQYIVGLNNSETPFTNRLVRQALAYLVPYETIINDVFAGHANQSRSPIPVKGQFHNGNFWPYTMNIEKAKELLQQAGLPNGFSFVLALPLGDPTAIELAILLQSSFKKAGVLMSIDTQTAAVFAERLDKRSHQAWLRDFLLYVDDPGYMGAVQYRSAAILNFMAYQNPQVDQLFDRINLSWRPPDRERKSQLCDSAQKLIVEDAPLLYLGEPNFNLAVRDDLVGYVHQPDNLLCYAPLYRK